jgi:RNA ligase (TIGR02306 family)
MSEFKVTVVRVGRIEKHPNADRLGFTRVFDYPVITGFGDFAEGDLAVYVPVDSVVPLEDPRWAFLQGHARIKAKRLRGIFSMGLLTKAADGWKEGDDVREALRIVKYEPPEPLAAGGENEKGPGGIPVYTDIEGFRRWPDILREGEEVHITEKIHGANGRWVFHAGRLWAGSHTCLKKRHPDSAWWKAAAKHDLENALAKAPGLVFYGEVYGAVQDLKYGHEKGGVSLALFDAFEIAAQRYLDVDEFESLVNRLGLPLVPRLYRGPWSKDLMQLSEGKTLLRADHVREGFVVRPVKERFDERIGRVILKRHGEGYLLRS